MTPSAKPGHAAAPLGLGLKVAALAVPVLAFFAPVLFLGRVLYLRDTGLYFYPHKMLIARALREGRLPQWDPQQFLGLPLLADPNFNVFHPLSLLCLLPEPWGFQLFVAACALLCAWGGYLLARQLEASERGALITAFAFAWSGPFVAFVEGGQLVSAAFMPWLCAAAAALARAPTRRRTAALAAAAALVFLSGTPEVGACGFVIAAVLAWPGGARARLGFALACLLGAALAAVQLFPTAAWLRESSRAGGFDFSHATSGSLQPWRLLGLIAPRFSFAQDGPGTLSWLEGTPPYLEDVYLGAVPLLLALFARPRRALLALAALFVLLALGEHTPLYAALWKVAPPLRSIRFPEKLLLPVALIAALHAGWGWDALRARAVPRARLFALCCAALALGVFALRFLPWTSLGELRATSLRGTALVSLPAELALAALALVALARRQRLLLAALFALDLALAAGRLDFTVPARELTQPSPLAALILRDPAPPWSYRVDVQPAGLTAEDAARYGEPGWPRPRAVFNLRHLALFDSGAELTGLHFARGYSGFTSGGARTAFQSGTEALSQLAVRYAVSFGSPGHKSIYAALGFEELPGGDAPGFVHLWRNPRALQRLRLSGPGEAKLVKLQPERVEALIDSAAPAQALLADTMAAGWTATLDGAPAPALSKDGLRAVAVPAGHHELVWSYRAPGLVAGAWVSLLALAALGAMTVRRRAGRNLAGDDGERRLP